MVLPVDTETGFDAGTAQVAFEVQTPDSQRFLMMSSGGQDRDASD